MNRNIKYKVSNNKNAGSYTFGTLREAEEYAVSYVKEDSSIRCFITKMEDMFVIESNHLITDPIPVIGVDCDE